MQLVNNFIEEHIFTHEIDILRQISFENPTPWYDSNKSSRHLILLAKILFFFLDFLPDKLSNSEIYFKTVSV